MSTIAAPLAPQAQARISAAWRAALTTVTELALAHYRDPETQGRIERGSALVLWQGVLFEEDGRCQVRSTSHPGVWHVVGKRCGCHDAQHRAPDHRCKHVWARALYLRAGEQLRNEASQGKERDHMTPEALFSLTLKGSINGMEALLTARGQTWEEFDANVARIKGMLCDARAHAAGGRSPEAPPPVAPVCPTHGPMKESTKAKGTWFCPKKGYDGSYCQSRYPER